MKRIIIILAILLFLGLISISFFIYTRNSKTSSSMALPHTYTGRDFSVNYPSDLTSQDGYTTDNHAVLFLKKEGVNIQITTFPKNGNTIDSLSQLYVNHLKYNKTEKQIDGRSVTEYDAYIKNLRLYERVVFVEQGDKIVRGILGYFANSPNADYENAFLNTMLSVK